MITKDRAIEVGESNAGCALDQRADHDTAADAYNSYLDNVFDTLFGEDCVDCKLHTAAHDAFHRTWVKGVGAEQFKAWIADNKDRALEPILEELIVSGRITIEDLHRAITARSVT